MFSSWRSSILLALLFLIALILVLPQVNLPDYLRADSLVKGLATLHVAQSSNSPIFSAAVALVLSIQTLILRAVLLANTASRTPAPLSLLELRC